MTRTLLVLGPARTGKTLLIQTLAGEHPDHRWHVVQLKGNEDESRIEAIAAAGRSWAGAWHMRYRGEDVLTALPDLVRRIDADVQAKPTVIAFESAPDPVLRQAYAYDLRVFVVPPIDDVEVMFRSNDEARLALRQILRDSTTFSDLMFRAGQDLDVGDPAQPVLALPDPSGTAEVHESQVEAFLAQPLGVELAMRVHLQEEFSAMADADVVILNTAAGNSCCERNVCWQRLLALLGRVRKGTGRSPLTYACDLSDPEDPCFVRIRRRMSEVLCAV